MSKEMSVMVKKIIENQKINCPHCGKKNINKLSKGKYICQKCKTKIKLMIRM